MVKYAIRKKELPHLYLQGVEANEKYCSTAAAPTMGTRHDLSEYRTIWDTFPKYFERMTACNYVKTIMEEFRWGDRELEDIVIEVLPE